MKLRFIPARSWYGAFSGSLGYQGGAETSWEEEKLRLHVCLSQGSSETGRTTE